MKNTNHYLPAMFDAHCRGDVDAICKLLAAHPELEKMGPDDNNIPWLHCAAEHGQIVVIEYWLERGCSVNLNRPNETKADGLVTALHVAKNADTTRYLTSRGAMVNAYHRVYGTPLHVAIARALEPSRQRHPEGANMDQIRCLLEASADLTLMNGEGKGFSPLAWAIHLRRKTAEHLLRELGAPEKGRRLLSRRAKVKTLDLRKDFDMVYQYIVGRVREFDSAKPLRLGGPGKIEMIHVGFEVAQAGWVVLVFDTRPGAKPDGEWTSEIEGNELKMPHWHQAAEANMEKAITTILADGTQIVLPADTELVIPLGDMLKAVLLRACESDVFAGLPKAPGCELSIEDFNGAYGWLEKEARERSGAES